MQNRSTLLQDMLYLDTSLLVTALTKEAETTRVQRWLSEQEPAALAVSDWVVAEFSAALSLKVRSRRMTAARFADQFAVGLRAGDALHLVICADHGAALCTLDRVLGKAGPALGVKTLVL